MDVLLNATSLSWKYGQRANSSDNEDELSGFGVKSTEPKKNIPTPDHSDDYIPQTPRLFPSLLTDLIPNSHEQEFPTISVEFLTQKTGGLVAFTEDYKSTNPVDLDKIEENPLELKTLKACITPFQRRDLKNKTSSRCAIIKKNKKRSKGSNNNCKQLGELMNKSDNALNIQNRDTPDYEETLSTCRDRIRQNNKTPTTITPYTISPSISEKDITEKAPPTSEPDISEPGIQQFDLMDFMNTNDSCLDSILSDFLSEEQTDTCQIPDPLPPQNSSENGSGTSLSELNPFDSNSAITPTSQNNLLIQEILNLRHGLAQSEYHCETLKAENLMLSQENSTLRMKNSETIQRHKASCKTIEYAANKLKIGSLEVQRDKKRLEQTVNQREIEISTLKKKLTDKKNVNKILRANIGSTASSQKSTDQSQTTALIDKCKQLFDMLGVQCPDTDSASLTKAIDSSLAVVEQYNIENKSSIDQLKQSSAVRIEPLTKDSLILLLANSKVNIMTITRFLEHSNKLFKKIVNDEKDCVNHLGSTIESLNRQLTSGQIKTNNALGTLKLFESYHEKIKGLQKIKTDLITDNYTTLTAVKNAKINDCEIYQGIINKNNSSSLKRKIETPESTLGIKYLKTL